MLIYITIRSKFREVHSSGYFIISQNVILVYFIIKPNFKYSGMLHIIMPKQSLSIGLLLYIIFF